MKPVRIQKVVHYECGCYAEYTFIGGLMGIGKWVGFMCHNCFRSDSTREQLEQRAEFDWQSQIEGAPCLNSRTV